MDLRCVVARSGTDRRVGRSGVGRGARELLGLRGELEQAREGGQGAGPRRLGWVCCGKMGRGPDAWRLPGLTVWARKKVCGLGCWAEGKERERKS